MKNVLLLPNRFKKIGWIILIPATALGLVLISTHFEGIPITAKAFAIINENILGKSQYFRLIDTNITNTIVGALFITGALLVSFSKEKNEDEFISAIRQSSWLWAVLINYLLLLLAFIFIYGTTFLNVMLYNMFTVLVIYIAAFNYTLHRNTNAVSDEKQD